jgi:hypothetical protein
MPTLRQKVNAFCKGTESKVSKSDKLLVQVQDLKIELKKLKDTHKHELHLAKAAAKTMKAPKSPKAAKAPKVKQQVQMNPLPALPAQAEPMMPAPAPSLAPAAGPKGGHTRRRLRR